MKKKLNLILVTLLLTGILISCKKSCDTTPLPKDYTASIKDKSWWGEFTYAGETAEYYSVHFNADNTLTWSQFSGDYTGHWILTGKQLTITFDGNSEEIKANVSDDDKLVNITDNTTASEINNGQLSVNSTIPLDNTVWNGTIRFTSIKALQLNFKPGLQVVINQENMPVNTYTYTKNSSNSVIRVGGSFFGIITSDDKMKGSNGGALFIWQAIKQ
jgi:hypothetical protein